LIPTSVPQHPDAGTTELASAVASSPNYDWLAVSCSALGMMSRLVVDGSTANLLGFLITTVAPTVMGVI
jgi:hypothetical protein